MHTLLLPLIAVGDAKHVTQCMTDTVMICSYIESFHDHMPLSGLY